MDVVEMQKMGMLLSQEKDREKGEKRSQYVESIITLTRLAPAGAGIFETDEGDNPLVLR